MSGVTRRVPKQLPSLTTKRPLTTLTVEAHVSTHAEIAARARALHESSGHASDRDVEFWLEAERQLRVELNA
jgi:hypothetical protein